MPGTSGFSALPPDPTAAGVARSRVRGVCGPTCAEPILDDLELLVSEVVGNAIRYGHAPIELAIDFSRDDVLVRVRNHGDGQLRLIDPDPTDEHGRGLLLVDALSDRWGVREDAAATVVWFTIGLG